MVKAEDGMIRNEEPLSLCPLLSLHHCTERWGWWRTLRYVACSWMDSL